MKLIKLCPLLCVYFTMSFNAFGQSPPVDLADLSLGDLLNAKIIRSQSNQITQDNFNKDLLNRPKAHLVSDRLHVSLSYIDVKFDTYKDGTKDLSTSDVLWSGPGSLEARTDENFPVVPTIIYQQAVQFTASYDISERYSIHASIPYIRQETEHISSVPGFSDFTIVSQGIGDIEIGASWFVPLNSSNSMLFNLGLSLPTGSIDEKGHTPRDANRDTQLPYTMQLGSGTYDLRPSITYTGKSSLWRYGASLNLTLRTGKNSRNYSLGNVYQGDIWTRYERCGWIQPSFRVNAIVWDRISGQDDEITTAGPYPYPAAVTNPDYFGGTKFITQFGLRLKDPKGLLKNTFLELEAGLPIYQRLNGPQPSENWRMSASFVLNF